MCQTDILGTWNKNKKDWNILAHVQIQERQSKTTTVDRDQILNIKMISSSRMNKIEINFLSTIDGKIQVQLGQKKVLSQIHTEKVIKLAYVRKTFNC